MKKEALKPIEKDAFDAQLKEYKATGKKVLYLPVKQIYFDQIAEGTKDKEYREVTPKTVARYIELDEEGYEKEDEYHNAIPRHYDALHLAVGYSKNRDEMLVEVKEAYTEMFVDDDNKPIEFEIEEGRFFYAEQVVYCLGKVTHLYRK